jgi:iron complex outermembrane receptor protein
MSLLAPFTGVTRARGAALAVWFAGVATGALVAAGVTATSASAAERTAERTYDIPAQPLASALVDLSQQGGINVAASQDLTRGRSGAAVHGAMTADRALARVLTGSDLGFAPGADGSFVITPRQAPGKLAQNAPPETRRSSTAAASPSPAVEQSASLAEVVVTARRRTENLQAVPVAATVVPQAALDRRGSFDITNLVELAPSLNFINQSGTRSDVVLAIRGQSKTYGGRFPSTITYFDDVPVLKLTTGQFFDLDSVQVLRGPQGTLFGRVTDGGNVMLNPRKPSNEFGGYIEAKLGNYNLNAINGAINLPIVADKVALRVAFDRNRRDGYTLNLLTDLHLDDVNYNSYRVGLDLKPTDNFENYTVYSLTQGKTNGSSNQIAFVNQPLISAVTAGTAAAFGIPAASANALGAQTGADFAAALAAQQKNGPRVVNEGNLAWGPNGGIFDNRRDYYIVNTTTWHILPDLQVKNIAGYVRVKDHWGADYDGTTVPFIDEGNPIYPHYDFNYEQWSEELQFQGKLFDRLDYTFGAYFDEQNTVHPSENQTVELQVINRIDLQYERTNSQAGYGQVSYDLGDFVKGLKLDAGIRYTSDQTVSDNASEVGPWDPTGAFFGLGPIGLGSQRHGVCDAANNCVQTSTSSNAVTYTAGLNYQINSRTMIYGKVSRGYRPGGINSVSGDPALSHYGPEYDLSTEIGAKADYDIAGAQARTNIAIFHDDYSQIQKLVDTVGANGTIDSVITNAPNGTIWGIELEQTVIPFRGLTVSASWTYLNAEFDHDKALEAKACQAPYIGFCDLSQFQGAPKNAGNLDVRYTLPLEENLGPVSIGFDLYGRTKTYAGDTSFYDPHWELPGYVVANMNVSWERIYGSPASLTFFMNNMFNTDYLTGTTSIEHNLGFAAKQYGEPRMYGFSVRYEFGQN